MLEVQQQPIWNHHQVLRASGNLCLEKFEATECLSCRPHHTIIAQTEDDVNAKDCLLAGLEQACSWITRLVVLLFGGHHSENGLIDTQKNGC